ncbi:predicted protein [Scheffersomyces stipitis CBS 6054]|uniref:NAD-dependent epimerase/dehydratase domain-containing protein n=1 Tax=Scheffersomyces stipitis (strain ATCC 58785 / CBS 6054 / NBRC 10063 / NRRL Y-11545) TaxID=322104 RepID=A3GH79_PICST|nr:predicted protein [Scheffersomyces stipitis CBS 6054]EAZ62772.2 predicted protein [Scheffersomyces stipitis CBS 6054]KAG2735660.1 hypothetical protein G9P44_001874 [Scheffersomyces stipitis]
MSTQNKVLLVGATGYIGHQAALALRRNNYLVYGLARSEAKAVFLAKDELIPIIGTGEKPDYLDEIVTHEIHTVIDFTGTPTSTADILEKLQSIVTEKKFKVNFIYISGIWVHGDSSEKVTEADKPVIEKVGSLVKYRVALEEKILSLKDIIPSIIIRPGILFGGKADIWGVMFGQVLGSVLAGDSTVTIPLREELTSGFIHNEDLAQLIFLAVEKFDSANSAVIKSPIFDVISETVNVPSIIVAGADELGFKGTINFTGHPTFEENPLLESFDTNVRCSNELAKKTFGWEPKIHLAENLALLVRTWVVHQNEDFYTTLSKK